MASDGTRASVWLAGKPAAPKRKGDGPALDLPRIVATTVRMLDAEGLAKFSMRRLAAELGVTAMSVYWYVATKDDLLELALDEVSAELTLPDPADENADWRDQLRQLAVEYRKVLVAHPWVGRLVGQYLNIGPHAMAFSETALAVMRRSGISMEGTTGALSVLFQFVYGFSTVEAQYRERCREAGVTEEEHFLSVMNVVRERDEFSDSYKEAAELMESRVRKSVAEMREADFAYALETVIAGIETMRDRTP
ncbi:TetR/AcrR family transcriptional regulator [Streptomyces sp. NPDC049577]|uniref:TetR/AcrR family transcriptional regulator n=1 Tax=Streptomyces sp. NPDC049577 TaxID=3155153 RepID=UPI00343AD262